MPEETKPTTRYDVVGVNLLTNKVRIIAFDKNLRNADAIVGMAVARRGISKEFFSECRAGKYHDGADWKGRE